MKNSEIYPENYEVYLYNYLDVNKIRHQILLLINKIKKTKKINDSEKYFFEISDLQFILAKYCLDKKNNCDEEIISLINIFERLDDTGTLESIYDDIKNDNLII